MGRHAGRRTDTAIKTWNTRNNRNRRYFFSGVSSIFTAISVISACSAFCITKDSAMTTFSSLPRLGVGLNYQPGVRTALGALGDLIDFFEISPDLLCRERARDGERALDYHPALLEEALH